jgi:hypothetical protein
MLDGSKSVYTEGSSFFVFIIQKASCYVNKELSTKIQRSSLRASGDAIYSTYRDRISHSSSRLHGKRARA